MNQLLRPGFLVIFLLSFALPAAAQLSGIYTIDPGKKASKTNYVTIQSAVHDMVNGYRTDTFTANGKGVNGPVVFKLADGLYEESIAIDLIQGVNFKNTITFESQSGDSSKVIISTPESNSPSIAYLYTTGIFGKFITFKNLTLARTSAGYNTWGKVVFIGENADHIRFQGCQLKHAAVGLFSDNNELLEVDGAKILNLTLENNYFSGGRMGLDIRGGSHVTVRNNYFTGSLRNAIYILDCSSVIENNTVNSNVAYDYYAIFVNKGKGNTLIQGNKIQLTGGGTGIYASGANPTDTVSITNNYVSIKDDTGDKPVCIALETGCLKIVHNNLLLHGSYTTSYYPVEIAGPSVTGIIANNNITNSVQRECFRITYFYSTPYPPLKFKSDYNNLYSTNQNILKDWRTLSLQDSHSISTDPEYKSNIDLHSAAKGICNKGRYLGYPAKDIDSRYRNLKTPDIGSNELDTLQFDAMAAEVAVPKMICAGINDVMAVVQNNGKDTLKELTLNWQVNQIPQDAYPWTGAIAPGQSARINVGSYYFEPGIINKIAVIADRPNDTLDQDKGNDTAYALTSAGMAGLYTIGGTAPDFKDFSAAASFITKWGMCGNVTLNLRDGTYAGKAAFDSLQKSNPALKLIIQSESGDKSKVKITCTTADSSGQMLSIRSVSHVTIRGLTFEYDDTSKAKFLYEKAIVSFTGNCPNLLIEKCAFKAKKSATYLVGVNTMPAEEGNVIIRNNHFIGLNRVTYPLLMTAGKSSEYYPGNIYVYENRFDSVGFLLTKSGTPSTDSAFITKNTFNQTSTLR